MIWSLLIFAVGFWLGHYVSPTIDDYHARLIDWWDPDISDQRNIDRNDWGQK